jgi:hypothetical protein
MCTTCGFPAFIEKLKDRDLKDGALRIHFDVSRDLFVPRVLILSVTLRMHSKIEMQIHTRVKL